MYRPNRLLPAHITIPNWSAYQVRIVRDGVEHSESFSWKKFAGEMAALAEAIKWRDAKLAELGASPVGFRDKPLRNKKSGCPAGITAYLRSDHRRNGLPQYLTYGVHYTNSKGKKSTRSFQVGNIEMISQLDKEHAALTAMAFRADYICCRRNGVEFKPEKYASWQLEKRYPFIEPTKTLP